MSKHAIALPTVAAGQPQQLADSFDLILLENSLLILERGVLEGRRVFGNIIKYVKMAASSNFGNMFSVVGAGAFLHPSCPCCRSRY